MKAARIHEYGGSEQIKIEEIDTPVPREAQVLMTVRAASVNPFDVKLREGAMKESIPLKLPITLGGDVAGIVKEVGEGVTELAVGDEVYGKANAVSGASGAMAEAAVTSANQLAKKPTTVDFAHAGAIPLTGVSALQVIEDKMHLQSGQRILIHGGAGGIGTAAIQLAKHLGAYVATTATGDQIEYVKQLGADEVIDYKSQEFDVELSGFDFVLDTIGGDTYRRSYKVLKPRGLIVSMLEEPNEAWIQEFGVNAQMQSTKISTSSLQRLAELIDKRVITIEVASEFTLENTKAAFDAYESGNVKGKVVVVVKE